MTIWQTIRQTLARRPAVHSPARAEGKTLDVRASAGFWDVLEGALSRVPRSADLFSAKGDAQYEQDYAGHALVYACVRKIALSAAEPVLRVRRREGGVARVVEPHPALDLLDAPNPFCTGHDLTHAVVSRLLLTGKAYVWKWRGGNGAVGELWPVPSSWVRPNYGEGNRLIESYSVAQGRGRSLTVPAGDMVHLRFIDPATLTEGIGPLQAAQHDHQLDVERQTYLVEFLRNAPIPGMKLRVKGNLTQRQRDDLRAALADKSGRGKRGSPLVLEGDADAEMIGAAGDMDWPGLTALSESRICAAFGVPPILVGARVGLDRSTFANYEEARRSFYAETLRPLWRMMESALTAGLLRAEGHAEEELFYDLDGVQELQEDRDKRAARGREGWKSGLLTRNEARVAGGYEPVPEGDVYLLPVGVEERRTEDRGPETEDR